MSGGCPATGTWSAVRFLLGSLCRTSRLDPAGTPLCFTIDGQTKQDDTVTVRDRDDASQVRINKDNCVKYLRDKLGL